MTVKDFTNAPYYAISSIGYGKGFTEQEAVDNYVRLQLEAYPAGITVFKTRPRWREALTSGDARAQVWKAPTGTVGFVSDGSRLWWKQADGTRVEADYETERVK